MSILANFARIADVRAERIKWLPGSARISPVCGTNIFNFYPCGTICMTGYFVYVPSGTEYRLDVPNCVVLVDNIPCYNFCMVAF